MKKNSTVWLWVLGVCNGCFPSQQELDQAAPEIRVLSVNVLDARGASWPLDAGPRSARLELALDRVPDQADKRVWLVRGGLDDGMAADLLDPPLRKDHQDRVVACSVVSSKHGVTVSTTGPLARGQRYTLAVLEAPERLWSRELRVSETPAAGAAFVEGLPADQARGVPPNLRSMLLRFDGYLQGGHQISLRAGDEEVEARTSLARCSELGLAEGDCMTIQPERSLPPQTSVLLEVSGLRDATGASLAALTIHFDTGPTPDAEPPALLELACGLDERALDAGGCVLEQDRALTLRLSVDEPTFAALATTQQTQAALSFGRDVEVVLDRLAPASVLPSRLTLSDLAGNTRTLALALATHDALPSLSIDEVRCDPHGPEPAQETIELLNFGGEPIQIMGFSVSDDPLESGVRIRDDVLILPGERVLVVGPEFDARDASDGPLAPGVRLARTDKALSLSNDGSIVLLRDSQMRRISAAPRLKPAQAGACIARISADPRRGWPADFAHDPQQSCTPGVQTLWP